MSISKTVRNLTFKIIVHYGELYIKFDGKWWTFTRFNNSGPLLRIQVKTWPDDPDKLETLLYEDNSKT